MFSMWRASLRRSWLSYLVIGILYLLSYIQISFYQYFKILGQMNHALIEAGYLIGTFGFAAGIVGLQFILAREYTSEMGTLETIGYRRSTYILFYLAQFAAICFAACLLAVGSFMIFYSTDLFTPMATDNLVRLHIDLFWQLFSTYTVTMLLSLFIQSAKDPMLMVREK